LFSTPLPSVHQVQWQQRSSRLAVDIGSTKDNTMRRSLLPLLVTILLMLGFSSQASADEALQYVSDSGATMSMYLSSGDNVRITGKGKFSVYQATCNVVSDSTITCTGTGTGTRISDDLKYTSTYTLVSPDDGQTVTQKWKVTYTNGEKYDGVVNFRRVN